MGENSIFPVYLPEPVHFVGICKDQSNVRPGRDLATKKEWGLK